MAARATVIIPTYGEARFARWAIQSVAKQTVKDIEICIICDGSPAEMVSFFEELAKDDPRIRVFPYPKSPRTGEPYRDEVIRQTTGEIICYCCHDDLWFPGHIETVEAALKECDFTHTIHAAVNTPEEIKGPRSLFYFVYCIDLHDKKAFRQMINRRNYFGLTYAAHTRESYYRLKQGWETTPVKEYPTDWYMWRKILSDDAISCQTVMKITALNFPYDTRKGWPEQKRSGELQQYIEKMQDPHFKKEIEKILSRHMKMKRWRLNYAYISLKDLIRYHL
ncbi:MAG: glycosyltransferase family A protein [Christensenellales bacterium]